MKKIRNVVLSTFVSLLAFNIALINVSINSINAKEGDGIETNSTSPLFEKTTLFFGDSICEASVEKDSDKVGYAGRIGETYKMNYQNVAVSGASYSTCRETNRIITQIEKVRDVNADLVILQGGINDAWDNAPLGEESDSYNFESFKQDTFAGAFEAAICKAREFFPQANIGYIVTYRTSSAEKEIHITSLNDENTKKYYDMAKNICKKWEVPYLDLFSDENLNDKLLKIDTKDNLLDYVHPNSNGYDILTDVISEWMEGICFSNDFMMLRPTLKNNNNTGIRFTVGISDEKYNEVYNNPTKHIGTFIFPSTSLPTDVNYDTFDYSTISKKLVVNFVKDDFFLSEKNDQKSGNNSAWYANAVLTNPYMQNYEINFVGVGFIATTIDDVTTYEYASLSDKGISYTSIINKAVLNGEIDANIVSEITEKCLYASMGAKETRIGGTKYVVNGVNYTTFDELKTANQIGIDVEKSSLTVEEYSSIDVEPYFTVGGVKTLKNPLPFTYQSMDENIAKVNNGKINGIKEGSTQIVVSSGKYSKTIELTVTTGPVFVEGMRDEYSGCFDITNNEGSAQITWPKAGTSKGQWAKTEAYVYNYKSEYKYMKLVMDSTSAHKVGIYYSSAKYADDETCIITHTDINAGNTVWYLSLPESLPETFEIRYFIDTALSNDTGEITIKTEFVKEKPVEQTSVVGAFVDTYDSTYSITANEDNTTTISWTNRTNQYARVEAPVTNYNVEDQYLKLSITSEESHEIGVAHAPEIWGAEQFFFAHTKVEAGTQELYVKMPNSMADHYELRFYIDAVNHTTNGTLTIKAEFVKIAHSICGEITATAGHTVVKVENGYNVQWVANKEGAYVPMNVVGYSPSTPYFNFTIKNEGSETANIGVWWNGWSNCWMSHTPILAEETKTFSVSALNVEGSSFDIYFFTNGGLTTAGNVTITNIYFSENQN